MKKQEETEKIRFSFERKHSKEEPFSFEEIPGEKNVVRGSIIKEGSSSIGFIVFAVSEDQFEKLSWSTEVAKSE